jgi:hypothetical protein
MSDTSRGEGWWQAADGKWYAPEQHPDHSASASSGPSPTSPTPPPPGPRAGRTPWIIGGVIAAVVAAVAAFVLLGGDDDKKQNLAASSSTVSSTSSSFVATGSASTTGNLTTAELEDSLLTAADVAPDFIDQRFVIDESPTSCGQPNVDSVIPPTIHVGSQVTNGSAVFKEEILVYADVENARNSLVLSKESVSCSRPTLAGGEQIVFSDPRDVSSELGAITVDEAFEIRAQSRDSDVEVVVIRRQQVIVAFQFAAVSGTDTSKLPDTNALMREALLRLPS